MNRLGPIAPGDALVIASQLTDGIAAAHRQGVVHRDLKPENILLTAEPDSRVVVMDFGLAKALPPHPKAGEFLSSAAPGTLIGTLHYLAPEQIAAAAASAATDVHALGVILYEMVCGQRPFDDSDRTKVLDLIRQSPPAPPRTHAPTLDVAFETVIMRCLAKRPEDRYQDAGEVAAMLRDAQPTRSSPDSRASTLSLTRGTTAGAAGSSVDPAHVYREALDLARNGDTVGWRQLRKEIRPGVFDSVVAWRTIHEKTGIPAAKPEAQAMISDALLRLAPLFALALAGVESGRRPFNDQKETIDELLQIPRWPPNGLSRLVELPETFGYFYQGLHGALCLSTRQLPLAMDLADRKVMLGHREYRPVWKWHGLVGWPDGLGSNSIDAWNSLNGLATEWPWLKHVFEGEDDMHASLAAYYMALNIGEMIWTLTNSPGILKQKDARFEVPVTFGMIDDEIGRAALKLLLRDREGLEQIWKRAGHTTETVRSHWPDWLRLTVADVQRAYPYSFRIRLYYEHLFDIW